MTAEQANRLAAVEMDVDELKAHVTQLEAAIADPAGCLVKGLIHLPMYAYKHVKSAVTWAFRTPVEHVEQPAEPPVDVPVS